MKQICVFAGSSAGHNPAYTEEAKKLGKAFAEKNIELVYGGAKSGLMGVLADSILQQGGKVTGVMPTELFDREIVHTELSDFIEVDTMHERKAKMSELADGYIALPGGFGTFEELFETVSWAQIGLHKKPVALFNIEEYYTPLKRLIEHAIEAGFVPESNRSILVDSSDPYELLDKLNTYHSTDQ